MEITVFRSAKDLANNKWFLRAPITCPDTFVGGLCANKTKEDAQGY